VQVRAVDAVFGTHRVAAMIKSGAGGRTARPGPVRPTTCRTCPSNPCSTRNDRTAAVARLLTTVTCVPAAAILAKASWTPGMTRATATTSYSILHSCAYTACSVAGPIVAA
jgi:hypothetical protein